MQTIKEAISLLLLQQLQFWNCLYIEIVSKTPATINAIVITKCGTLNKKTVPLNKAINSGSPQIKK